MSNDTRFLARWSRRKHDAAIDKIKQSNPEHLPAGTATETPSASPAPGQGELPFDPASLPAVESIGAGSDIRAFLKPGVPAELRRAALRCAWSSDASIRDFVGLSENSWDFNAAGAMAGFGPIDKEDVGHILTRLSREPDAAAQTHPPPMLSPANKAEGHADPAVAIDLNEATPASALSPPSQPFDTPSTMNSDGAQSSADGDGLRYESACCEPRQATQRHRHGGALPKFR
jgi:hypothetical protein